MQRFLGPGGLVPSLRLLSLQLREVHTLYLKQVLVFQPPLPQHERPQPLLPHLRHLLQPLPQRLHLHELYQRQQKLLLVLLPLYRLPLAQPLQRLVPVLLLEPLHLIAHLQFEVMQVPRLQHLLNSLQNLRRCSI